MEELALQQPELIGREEELNKLKQSLDNAIASKGSTVFISGEAGIGKTRLVSELIKEAESKGAQIIQGWCLAESLEPLMPIKIALRKAGLIHLISGTPPPLVVSAYLINKGGLLMAKVEREKLEFDADIFASMLNAVGDFVKDSFSMMGKEGGTGLNALGYENYRILIQTQGNLSLATVIEGGESEFLIDDMKGTLVEIGGKFDDWSGDFEEVNNIVPKMEWYVNSGKYDGRFIMDDPKIKQENLFDNILLGIQRASQEKLVLLFLDDLQWSDPTSLNLLHYLSRNTRKNKVLLVGTYRLEDLLESQDGIPHQLETAMQNMNRDDLIDKIELKRLGPEDTEKIITSVLGKVDFDKKFYEKIYHGTEGTPFFILEVIKLLIEDGAIAQDEEGISHLVTDIDKLEIPSKVYDVVKRRLDRLKKEQREILEYASVIGEEFSHDVLADVLEKTNDVQRLKMLKILNEIEKTHRLIHDLENKHRFDHSKVREVLYIEISKTLRKEYHGKIAETIAELNNEKIDEVVSDLAYHYYEAGDEKAGEYLIKAGDKAGEEYANDEAIRLYNNALETIKDEETKARILRKAGLIHWRKGEFDPALEKHKNSLAVIEKIGEKHGIAISLNNIGLVYHDKGDLDRAFEYYERSLKIKEKIGDKPGIAKSLDNIGALHYAKGELDRALETHERSLEIKEKIEDKPGIATSVYNIGGVYIAMGELDRALALHERSMEETEDKRDIANALNNIGEIYCNKGELARALVYYERSLEIFLEIGDKWGSIHAYCGQAEAYLGKRETQTALINAEKAVEIAVEIGAKIEEGMGRRVRGMVYRETKDWVKAIKEFQKADSILEDVGDKGELARLFYEYGLLWKAKTNPAKAREHLEKALSMFEEMGMKLWEEKCQKALGEL